MKMVMDSSALVPVLHDEDESENAIRFMEMCREEGVSLAVSPLVYSEVGNCIVQFSKREGRTGKKFLNKFLGLHLERIPMDNKLLLSALSIAESKELTFYDAVHAASAASVDAPLITLDKELISKVDKAIDLREGIEYLEALKSQ
ncbi:MAG: type II toxin-antitoxin system VapC family toxin [Thermoplasmatota archaeon]